ncbi:MAG: hypothetical protein L0Z62_04220 [Gemmataceae bacterium]|nr:hypothetical protein [Gemmataceae bacterium]
MSSPLTTRWRFSFLAALTLVVPLSGCGGKRGLSQADLDRARQAVEASLETWKKGEPAAKLSALNPPVQMTDPDWKAGSKLLKHEIKKTEGLQGENARCWVVLSVQDRKGRKSDKDAVYEVNLGGGKVVIGRDPFN